jgi:formate dehydrogenase assembly factor FdhD
MIPNMVVENQKKEVPYVYQEFPRILYSMGGTKTVNTQAEMDDALAQGYSISPNSVSRADEIKKLLVYHKTEITKLEKEYDTLMKHSLLHDVHTTLTPVGKSSLEGEATVELIEKDLGML